MKKAFMVLLALALVAAFAMPAAAADKAEWSFYGSARFETNSIDTDNSNLTGTNDPLLDDRNTGWFLHDSSRIGAFVDAGHIGGRFEWGFSQAANASGGVEALRLRLLYGTWRYSDNGFFLVGKTYTPTSQLISGFMGLQGNGMVDIGAFYTDRHMQLKVEHNWGAFHAEMALVEPNSTTDSDNDPQLFFTSINNNEDLVFNDFRGTLSAADLAAIPGLAATTQFAGEDDDNVGDADTTLPKIEAMIRYNFGPLSARLWGGWNEYEMVINPADGNNNSAEIEVDVDAWQVGTTLEFAMGPFYAKGSGYFGENPVAYGLLGSALNVWWDPGTNAADGVGTMYDVDNWGWILIAGFKVNDMLSFEAGFGQTEEELDGAAWTDAAGNANPFSLSNKQDRWYVGATIKPVQGFSIIPEVAFTDNGDYDFSSAAYNQSIDLGDQTYYGVVWKIDF